MHLHDDARRLMDIITLDSELNKIKDEDILLERILREARKVVNSDAGTIYRKNGNELTASYAQNNTLQKALPAGEKLPYKVFKFPISKKTISGYVASTGKLVNIKDAYKIPKNAPYGYNKTYDQKSGYRSQSMLTVPLQTAQGELLGVIQMINKMNKEGEIVPFRRDDEVVVMHFAANATVTLQRAMLYRDVLMRMINMAELRDPKETGPHVYRVAGYSVEIYERWAHKNKIPEEELERNRDNLKIASMLHDVGKVAISDQILKKPARFTPEEYEIMKTHTLHGARLFKDPQSELDIMSKEVVLTHHENWDGSGYPGKINLKTGRPRGKSKTAVGLKGDEIPLWGRIVAIADVYDALRSKRVYKEAWTEDSVLKEIKGLKGTKFDPKLIDTFFEVLPAIQAIAEKYVDEE